MNSLRKTRMFSNEVFDIDEASMFRNRPLRKVPDFYLKIWLQNLHQFSRISEKVSMDLVFFHT